MPIVVLGNRHAVDHVRTGKTVDGEPELERVRLPKDKRATRIELPDDIPVSDALRIVTDPQGVWAAHAAHGAVPAWVASDDPNLATVLAAAFGGIETRDLED